QLVFQLLELGPHALAPRAAPHRELPLLSPRAVMREPEEVEGLWLPRAAASSCGCRKAAELDQARLLTGPLQVELSQPLLQLPSKALGIGPGLKTEDEVVGVAHDDHIVAGLRPSPALDPEVEYVVQVDVGEQRTDAAPLRGPTLHPSPFPVLQ